MTPPNLQIGLRICQNTLMADFPNPLSQPESWDLVSDGYTISTQPFLSKFAQAALPLGQLTETSHVLDVACGPGTLTLMAAQKAARVDAVDFSEKMVARLKAVAERGKLGNIHVQQADGQALPFEASSYDAAFSMFGIIFFPNRAKGFKEMWRVLKPGGRAVISSWAPLKDSPIMRIIKEVTQILAPDRPAPPVSRDTLEYKDVFEKSYEIAGFDNWIVRPITKEYRVNSVEEFWRNMHEGNVFLSLLKKELGEDAWAEKQGPVLERLETLLGPMPMTIPADAWLGVGIK